MKYSSVVNDLSLIFLVGHFNTEANGWMMMFPSPSSARRTTTVHSDEQAIAGVQSGCIDSFSRQASNSFQRLGPLWASTSEETEADALASIAKLRVSEIKQELEALKADYTDCFDKESMVARLLEARNSKIQGGSGGDSEVASSSASSSVDGVSSDDSEEEELEDEEAVLEKIRSMRVKELREELGRRRIPRAGLFDKEDLVQALFKANKMEAIFSATGSILPGCVADLSGDQVEQEIQHTATPLLLDVYATWCGPCQMIAPLLEQAAQESFSGGGGGGDASSKPLVRVVKMDSDANPQMASKLKVAGLPTLVLFQYGEEIDRLEGAPMKDQLVEWVTSKLQ
ncbi:MAG: hypothetical protein SGBAC_012128 [Bacillariaceae sp.]